ncbi:DNA methyltransferase [Nonlabens marinus]|uniref:site-specific DNA-methyltransferase (adenine-specific) n=1 Tax=Nonlabens marinus S1-08 TaxID=1454201 RepID=W8VS12_9FLAO|nr:DNA methyltransferase [Nonlabens marinus]BAO56599.1 type II restriction enzyme, methylase subunit YeeA [Nonlabens marinus S1-08]
MALSWNEIKDRALKFSIEWADETKERAEKDSFWNDFFNVFGISRRRVATFEEPVKKLSGNQGFIDLFWKGTLLVEHKSKGRNLDKAYTQATDYFPGLKDHELPKYILVSDFDRIKLFDLDERTEHEFPVSELYKNVKLFGFIAGYQKRTFQEEDPVNIKAAELMGKLHDQLEEYGYEGHDLEVYLVRLLFILFADDTSIFEKDTFKEFVDQKTNEDGSNLGALMAQFFQVLNTPREKRFKNLDEHLNAFPYVNGKLFEEVLPIASFNSNMRSVLLEASGLDWGKISPAIFGSLFQSVMNPEERRNLGAHYTSEKNIFKLIKPLFLDELRAEFDKVKSSTKKLQEFHQKLSTLKFLDPACGSGNFLIITYRELRLLEIDILRELFKKGEQVLDISSILWLDVDQFYGIEYDEFASKIAEVAMWLIDHQMNMLISEEFGQYFARLPLKKSATIVHGNSLRIDWEEVVPKTELKYIIGNPPFIGHQWRTKEQMQDMDLVFGKNSKTKRLDYVAAWFYKAAQYIQDSSISVALVATNSICQGEQVPILWNTLFNDFDINIHFGHQTFKWTNEAKGNAGVHVIIVGFGSFQPTEKILYEYDNVKSEAYSRKVDNVNGYLAAGPNVFITSRGKPIHNYPPLFKGSQPTDGGNLILNEQEKEEMIMANPASKDWIKSFLGGAEFLRNKKRFCLWLKNCPPATLKQMPLVLERLKLVAEARLKSPTRSVNEAARFPSLFTQDRQPETDYLCLSEVSSENREYIPIGFLDKDVICSNTLQIIPTANIFMFGALMSKMHITWAKYTAGRLESRIRYTPSVYNNYPWPKDPSDKNKLKVEQKAQKVLDARALFPDSSLADLYDPLTMPPALVKAHQELDKAVDLCYRPQAFVNENSRIEFLFDLYNQYTAPLLSSKKQKS